MAVYHKATSSLPDGYYYVVKVDGSAYSVVAKVDDESRAAQIAALLTADET